MSKTSFSNAGPATLESLGIVITAEPNFPLDEKIEKYKKQASQQFLYFLDILVKRWGADKESANRTRIDLFLLDVTGGVTDC